MEKPDWVFWLSRPSVTLEECVCLSLDAEPEIEADTQSEQAEKPEATSPTPEARDKNGELQAAPVVLSGAFHTHLWLKRKRERLAAHPAMQTAEARRRLAMLRRHFDAGMHLLSPAVESHLPGGRDLVNVADFARWAQLQKWHGPVELGLTPEEAPAPAESTLREALAEAEGARAVLEAQLSSMKTARAEALQELQTERQRADELSSKLHEMGQAPVKPEQVWPWGSHETKLLRNLAAAAERFWVRYDPTDSTTAPTNEEVSTWLQARGVSKRTADTMATILRADGLPTGPRT